MDYLVSLGAGTSNLDRRISSLSDMLGPAANDALPQCLGAMLASGMTLPSTIDPDMSVDVYRFALEGMPAVALQRTTERLIRGEYNRNGLGFIPTPPELAAIVRQEAAVLRSDLARLRATRSTIEESENARQPPDEASKLRIRDLVGKFKRGEL